MLQKKGLKREGIELTIPCVPYSELKEKLDAAGFTHKDIAEAAGVTSTTVYNWFNKGRPIPPQRLRLLEQLLTRGQPQRTKQNTEEAPQRICKEKGRTLIHLGAHNAPIVPEGAMQVLIPIEYFKEIVDSAAAEYSENIMMFISPTIALTVPKEKLGIFFAASALRGFDATRWVVRGAALMNEGNSSGVSATIERRPRDYAPPGSGTV